MKNVLLSLVLLVGCSTDKETVFVSKGTPGGNGSSCTTYPVEGGANVKCGDSITFIANGSKGDPGKDGVSCSVGPLYAEQNSETFLDGDLSTPLLGDLVVIGAKISCSDGTSQVVSNGSDGSDGVSSVGPAGSSCTVSPSANGATITCGDSSPVTITNGTSGATSLSYTLTPGTGNGNNSTDGACMVIDSSNSAQLNGNSSEVKLYSTTNCSGSSLSLHDGEVATTDNGNLLFNTAGTNALTLIKFN